MKVALTPILAIGAVFWLTNCCCFRCFKKKDPIPAGAQTFRVLQNGSFELPSSTGTEPGSQVPATKGRSPAAAWATESRGLATEPTLTYWRSSSCPEGRDHMIHVLNPGGEGGIGQNFHPLPADQQTFTGATATVWVKVSKGRVRIAIESEAQGAIAQVLSNPALNGRWEKYTLSTKPQKNGAHPSRLCIHGYDPTGTDGTMIFDVDNADVVAW